MKTKLVPITCPHCRGKGKFLKANRDNQTGHVLKYDYVTCPVCRGSGKTQAEVEDD